jgi:hypothetical protein
MQLRVRGRSALPAGHQINDAAESESDASYRNPMIDDVDPVGIPLSVEASSMRRRHARAEEV